MTCLHIAFRDINGRHGGVGDATSEETADHALDVVGRVVGHRTEIP